MPRVGTPAGYTTPEFASDLQDSLTTLGIGTPFGRAGSSIWSDLKNIGAQTAKKAYLQKLWQPGGGTTGRLAGAALGTELAPTEEMFKKYAESQDPIAPWTRSTDFDRRLMQVTGWGQRNPRGDQDLNQGSGFDASVIQPVDPRMERVVPGDPRMELNEQDQVDRSLGILKTFPSEL